MSARSRRAALVVVLLIGLGLAAAPVAFKMFSRAPAGGVMIDDFRPFMTQEQVDLFRGYLVEIGAADAATVDGVQADLIASGAITTGEWATRFSAVAGLHEQWPGIDADMTDLLDRMERNLDNFQAVRSLPPFDLFPWFFVGPGLAIAVVAAITLVRGRGGRGVRRWGWVIAAFGIGLIAAPAVFQMFTRAPEGADMIDDFRPMMTRDRVAAVQGYFITMGAAEGQLRTKVMTLVDESGGDRADYPAVATFSGDWPTIVVEFNPMVATMSDSLDNFAAVDAMPSFDLFPWFFVGPGVLVAGLGVLVARQRTAPSGELEAEVVAATPVDTTSVGA